MANNVNNDFATGLSTCIAKDGQSVPTANIPLGGFKLTGLAAGSTAGDSVRFEQLQNTTQNWVVAGGTADAITATYSPALTALVDGQLCWFRATAANATTTPTFSPNGLTARTITKGGGSALVAADIPAALAEVVLRYNLANTRWELIDPSTLSFAKSGANTDITSLGKVTSIDNGAATTLILKTNGQSVLQLNNVASTANSWQIQGAAAGGSAVALVATGTDTDVNVQFNAKGAGAFTWKKDNGATTQLNLAAGGALTGTAAMLSPITASLGADVNLSNTGTYFDGPSIAQGTSGTWFVSGTVTLFDTASAQHAVKLWDGTTVISSVFTFSTANNYTSISLSGFIALPASNLKLSVKDVTTVNGKIIFNGSGNSKDSTITAIRIG